MRVNGRENSRSNTALLRNLIKGGKIIVDVERGIAVRPDGTPFYTEENWCGYLRFRVTTAKGRKWFFVHKAVHLARGGKIKKGWEVDHINHDTQDNRGCNLRHITIKQNMNHRKPEEPIELPF